MPASQAEVQGLVQTWFLNTGFKPKCPVCGSPKWNAGIVCKVPHKNLPDAAFEVYPLVCPTCAWTAFLSVEVVNAGLEATKGAKKPAPPHPEKP